jgi:cellulose synthase (UDP-forming)
VRYVPLNLATGLCPSELSAFFRQQYRWCMGSMSLLLSRKFWDTRLPLRTRLCYLSGFFYYLQTALFTFVAPAIPLVMLYAFPGRVRLANYVVLIPALVFTLVVFPLWHRCRYGPEVWSVKLVYGWAHAFALLDTLRGRGMAWEPTGNIGGDSNRRFRLFKVGMAVWCGGAGLAWIIGAAFRLGSMDDVNFVPILLLGLFYCLAVGRVLFVPTTE